MQPQVNVKERREATKTGSNHGDSDCFVTCSFPWSTTHPLAGVLLLVTLWSQVQTGSISGTGETWGPAAMLPLLRPEKLRESGGCATEFHDRSRSNIRRDFGSRLPGVTIKAYEIIKA
jgi:hypothetical protein